MYERAIAMTTEEREERSKNLRRALENLTYAAAGFTGEERTRGILAMTLVSDLIGEGKTIDDHRQKVDSIVNQMADDFGPQAITLATSVAVTS